MNSIVNQFGSGLDFGALFSPDKKHLDNNELLSSAVEKLKSLQQDQLSTQSNSAVSMKLVYRSLESRFESFNMQKLTPERPEQAKNDHVFDFKEVAKNVLDFVSSTLKGAKANGASDEKMAELFQQARSGIEQGFSDAQEELGELNKLDNETSEGIAKSRDLIDQGINQLEQKLLPQNSTVSETATTNNVSVLPTHAPSTSSSTSNVQTALDYSSSASSSLSNTSDLSITTADGDIVTISFSDYLENNSSQQFSYANSGDNTQFGFTNSQSSYRETNFSFSVQGNLDDGEKKAIGDLIKNISKIEKSFFNGNLDKAFKQAQKLGYDSTELTGFSLDLQQTQTSSISQAYSEVSQFNDNPRAEEIAHHIQPVIDFANQFQQANTQAERLFGNKDNQMKNLLDSVFNAEFGQQKDMLDRLNSFIAKLS